MTPYQQTAKRRFPGYTVHGDGPFALANHSLCYVQLFAMPMLAQTELNERTDAKYCTLVEVKPDASAKRTNALRVTAETMEFRR
jgi:hypothetical protein